MNKRLLDICQQLPDVDVSEFQKFTSKWINYVKSNTAGDNIPETEWNHLFTRTNPVAGIDRGEMQDRIKLKNGDRETNERHSFVSNWDKTFLPILKDIVSPDSKNRIEMIKTVRDTMRNVIIQGGGRNTKAAINRMLITFCPDILIRIPNEENTKEFLELLSPFSNPEEPLTTKEDWVDNSTNIMEFLKRQLGDIIQKRTLWDVYISLKNSDKSTNNNMANNERDTTMLDKYISILKTNKNLILTGAPGTGKTYMAKEIAKAMGAEIGFVQFHPSYDYTDFVEGLRPKNDENGNVGFERKDGVFKEFCKKSFDVIRPSRFNEGYEEEALNYLKKYYNGEKILTHKQKKYFHIKIENGKIYAQPDSGNSYLVDDDTILKYLKTGEYNKEHQSTYPPSIGEYIKQNIYGKIEYPAIGDKVYIFIIDEINRGEISKIFGELFFSIDPGYRGEKGKVNTQYQNMVPEGDVFKNGFYVPENVYIIGTMNDIDRSVESMDFAMRRRFAWQEVTAEESYTNMIEQDPEFALVKDEIKSRMFNLNKAIVETEGLDEAYQIGAAYFRKYLDYQDKTNPFDCLWENHLKGLLFEYLRGNRRAKELLEKLHDAYNKKSLNE
jgi:hypothetical protein